MNGDLEESILYLWIKFYSLRNNLLKNEAINKSQKSKSKSQINFLDNILKIEFFKLFTEKFFDIKYNSEESHNFANNKINEKEEEELKKFFARVAINQNFKVLKFPKRLSQFFLHFQIHMEEFFSQYTEMEISSELKKTFFNVIKPEKFFYELETKENLIFLYKILFTINFFEEITSSNVEGSNLQLYDLFLFHKNEKKKFFKNISCYPYLFSNCLKIVNSIIEKFNVKTEKLFLLSFNTLNEHLEKFYEENVNQTDFATKSVIAEEDNKICQTDGLGNIDKPNEYEIDFNLETFNDLGNKSNQENHHGENDSKSNQTPLAYNVCFTINDNFFDNKLKDNFLADNDNTDFASPIQERFGDDSHILNIDDKLNININDDEKDEENFKEYSADAAGAGQIKVLQPGQNKFNNKNHNNIRSNKKENLNNKSHYDSDSSYIRYVHQRNKRKNSKLSYHQIDSLSEKDNDKEEIKFEKQQDGNEIEIENEGELGNKLSRNFILNYKKNSVNSNNESSIHINTKYLTKSNKNENDAFNTQYSFRSPNIGNKFNFDESEMKNNYNYNSSNHKNYNQCSYELYSNVNFKHNQCHTDRFNTYTWNKTKTKAFGANPSNVSFSTNKSFYSGLEDNEQPLIKLIKNNISNNNHSDNISYYSSDCTYEIHLLNNSNTYKKDNYSLQNIRQNKNNNAEKNPSSLKVHNFKTIKKLSKKDFAHEKEIFIKSDNPSKILSSKRIMLNKRFNSLLSKNTELQSKENCKYSINNYKSNNKIIHQQNYDSSNNHYINSPTVKRVGKYNYTIAKTYFKNNRKKRNNKTEQNFSKINFSISDRERRSSTFIYKKSQADKNGKSSLYNSTTNCLYNQEAEYLNNMNSISNRNVNPNINNSLTDKILNLKRELESKNNDNLNLINSNRKLSSDINNISKELKNLERKIEELQKNLKIKEEDYNCLKKENSELIEINKMLEEDNKTCTDKILELKEKSIDNNLIKKENDKLKKLIHSRTLSEYNLNNELGKNFEDYHSYSHSQTYNKNKNNNGNDSTVNIYNNHININNQINNSNYCKTDRYPINKSYLDLKSIYSDNSLKSEQKQKNPNDENKDYEEIDNINIQNENKTNINNINDQIFDNHSNTFDNSPKLINQVKNSPLKNELFKSLNNTDLRKLYKDSYLNTHKNRNSLEFILSEEFDIKDTHQLSFNKNNNNTNNNFEFSYSNNTANTKTLIHTPIKFDKGSKLLFNEMSELKKPASENKADNKLEKSASNLKDKCNLFLSYNNIADDECEKILFDEIENRPNNLFDVLSQNKPKNPDLALKLANFGEAADYIDNDNIFSSFAYNENFSQQNIIMSNNNINHFNHRKVNKSEVFSKVFSKVLNSESKEFILENLNNNYNFLTKESFEISLFNKFRTFKTDNNQLNNNDLNIISGAWKVETSANMIFELIHEKKPLILNLESICFTLNKKQTTKLIMPIKFENLVLVKDSCNYISYSNAKNPKNKILPKVEYILDFVIVGNNKDRKEIENIKKLNNQYFNMIESQKYEIRLLKEECNRSFGNNKLNVFKHSFSFFRHEKISRINENHNRTNKQINGKKTEKNKKPITILGYFKDYTGIILLTFICLLFFKFIM